MSFLASLTKEAPQLPSRAVFYAAEGMGKTSFGCHAPDPVFLMTAGETGLLSLLEAGQVPAVAHAPDDFKTWEGLWAAVEELLRGKHSFRTLVLDTGNGAENLLAASVCSESFGGKWADYNDYGRGVRIAAPIWGQFLGLLDELRVRRRMSVIFLHHAAIKAVSNPTGKDWDQHRPEAIDKMWGLTHKWADVIAYYGTRVTVGRDDKAAGEQRYLRCAPSAAVVAKNRYGLPDEITSPPGAANLWAAFAREVAKAKGKGRAAEPKAEAKPAADHDPSTAEPGAAK